MSNFVVERVALHLVDRTRRRPQWSTAEVDLGRFTQPEDTEALKRFFSGHLTEVWKSQDSGRTRSASLTPRSDFRPHYDALLQDDSQFFELSKTMAQRLYDVSQGTSSSPGLLMVLWFHAEGDEQPFLGLFKMDPGRADKIALRRDQAGEILLDLAVQHIEQALPDSASQVLKWAVTPHPTTDAFDAKVKDKESSIEPARYFRAFLGCELRPSEKKQAEITVEALEDYAEKYHPGEDLRSELHQVVDQLEDLESVTTEGITEKAQSVVRDFQPAAFQEVLQESGTPVLRYPAPVLRRLHLEYKLSNGILIRGPRQAMQNFVDIHRSNGGFEFVVTAAQYEKKYR